MSSEELSAAVAAFSAASRLDELNLAQAIMDSTPAVVYVVDRENRFVLINQEFARLFGMSSTDVVGRSLYDYFSGDVADQFVGNNRAVLERGAATEFEETVPHEDGLHTYISIKAPLFDSSRVAYAICGVSTDITERKRLTAALEAAHRQKDAFIATVVHELRQPLGAIQAALGVMRMAGPEAGARAAAVIERQAAQLARLVEDLLDASRVSQGKVSLQHERLSIKEIIEGAVNVAQPLVGSRGQTLRIALPEEPVSLHADATRLQQVFSNLLTNAAKFTDAGGRIDVSAERRGDTLVVRVRDTGRGIAPDVLPHVFDLFAQGGTGGGGLGIGLAIVRGLVELHGGTVEARSAGPGQGSEFIVRLPVSPASG